MALTNDLDAARKAAASLKAGLKGVPDVGAIGITRFDGGYAVRVNVDSVRDINNVPPTWQGVDIDFALVNDIQAQEVPD